MPRISRQGWSGATCSASVPSLNAASLMICNFRSTAATAIGFPRNASKSIPDVKFSIIAIASRMSLNQRSAGELKDKDRLAFRSLDDLGPQHLSVRQIGLHAQNVGQPIFDPGPAHQ